jgi:hypothetical protein
MRDNIYTKRAGFDQNDELQLSVRGVPRYLPQDILDKFLLNPSQNTMRYAPF